MFVNKLLNNTAYFFNGNALSTFKSYKWFKQPSREVLRKRCSENMQQIYRRTLMQKCDFNKVALQPY